MSPKKIEFNNGETVVYPKHGVGEIIKIESMEIASIKTMFYVVKMEQSKLTIRVPIEKKEEVGLRKISSKKIINEVYEILKLKPHGVFLSNGPGDPAATGKYAIQIVKELIKNNLPIFGICLGHQILALALGAKTKKMDLGHRGANHPVKNLVKGNVEITSQNHGFEVIKSSLSKQVQITHQSLFDNSIEGIRLKNKPVYSVQYHPESNPGPQDSIYLFEDFVRDMKKNAKKKRY